MSIVFSEHLILTGVDIELTLDHGVIGWRNIVTISNIAASSAEPLFPVTNLANPATFNKWQADDVIAQEITVTTGSAAEVDYVGIAKHNLGTSGISVSCGYYTAGPVWNELVAPIVQGDNSPIMLRFTAQALTQVVIRLGSGTAPAQIAVVYVGKLTVLPRKIYVPHVPITYGRVDRITNGWSEAGDFLGSIVLSEWRETSVELSLLRPEDYRTRLDPFLMLGRRNSFFFAWRPLSYPAEVGYCRLMNNPKPAPQSPHALTALTLELRGVA